jgi:RNA recognition motif-containing protein
MFNCQIISVKIIRNKQTGQPEGYGFIEFGSNALAEQVLQNYNGQMMPNGNQTFKLNWATSGAGEKWGDDGSDFTVFVGDLASDVTDFILQDTFKSHYPLVKGAKVVFDRITGHSKGYGFVKFGDMDEQTWAMTEMNGQYCSSRPMRLGQASNKKNSGGQQQQSTGMPASITYNVTCNEIYTYYLVC